MTAALRQALRKRIPISRSAVLIGSIAPDLPLYALSIGAYLYFHLYLGWSDEATNSHMFDDLYFHDYGWMAAHNLLHAPSIQLIALVTLWRHRLQSVRKRWWLFWFFAACALHTLADLATHYDDGPLPLFPFDWHTRIHSPVSYWDRARHADQFAIFELILNLVLIVYLLVSWFRGRRKAATPAMGGAGEEVIR